MKRQQEISTHGEEKLGGGSHALYSQIGKEKEQHRCYFLMTSSPPSPHSVGVGVERALLSICEAALLLLKEFQARFFFLFFSLFFLLASVNIAPSA